MHRLPHILSALYQQYSQLHVWHTVHLLRQLSILYHFYSEPHFWHTTIFAPITCHYLLFPCTIPRAARSFVLMKEWVRPWETLSYFYLTTGATSIRFILLSQHCDNLKSRVVHMLLYMASLCWDITLAVGVCCSVRVMILCHLVGGQGPDVSNRGTQVFQLLFQHLNL